MVSLTLTFTHSLRFSTRSSSLKATHTLHIISFLVCCTEKDLEQRRKEREQKKTKKLRQASETVTDRGVFERVCGQLECRCVCVR